MSSSRFFAVFALGAALLLRAEHSEAAGVRIPHGTVELVAENQWIEPAHESYLGLHFELEKGWHVYWMNPGDSGEPPRVTWHLPAGVTVGEMQWPTPQRLGTSSIVDYGYEDAVTLIVPMQVQPSLAVQTPALFSAQVKVLVCREMCIPGKAQLSLTLPVEPRPPASDAKTHDLFDATRKSLPHPAPTNWKFSVLDTRDSFVLAGSLGKQITEASFFPLTESQIDNAAAQKLAPQKSGFRLTLRKSDRLLKPIERLKGVLVLSAGRSYRIDVPVDKLGAAGNADNGARQP